MSQVADQAVDVGASQGQVILRARGIKKSFRSGDSQLTILTGTDLSLRAGEFVAIEGRSGSGKSTLLHILGALESVDEGSVQFDQVDYTTIAASGWSVGRWTRSLVGISALCAVLGVVHWFLRNLYGWASIGWIICAVLLVASLCGLVVCAVVFQRHEWPRAQLRNGKFGFVFQFYYLLPELNVLQNTMLAPMVEHSWIGFRFRQAALRKRATELLEQLGLGHRLKHRVNHLSGGERQRVAIARALMNSPRVLFADEPTGNLDVDTGKQIMAVLEKLHKEQGQTIVMVTHDRSLARQADRVLVLKNGKLESAG